MLFDDNKHFEQIHQNYLRETFTPKIPLTEKFTAEEANAIVKYGTWMEALTNNLIEPFTDEQRHFIEVVQNKDFERASTIFEKAWVKYMIRLDALTINNPPPEIDLPQRKLWSSELNWVHRS